MVKSVKEIKKILIEKNKVLSTAESCTGGLISSYLTDIPGSSNFIKQNFVTYANESKINILDVKKETIEKFGVVSSEVASEMACGLTKKYDSDFGISITGILGPKTYNDNNPKGTVFIVLASKERNKNVKYISEKKTRTAIKKDVAKKALDEFLTFLRENS